MERELRLPNLRSVTGADVGVLGSRRSQVSRVNRIVRIQSLGVADDNFLPFLTLDLQPNKSRQILPEVKDIVSRLGF